MLLSDISIKRPVFATMMMVTLVVLGVVAYQRLAIDQYPDVTRPTVVVQTAYAGASPEVMEREVSKPIEEALNTVQGVRTVTSTSSEGSSQVRVELELGTDVMSAQQEVQSKVARIRRGLPQDIQEPVIIRFDPNDRPIMSVAMQSDSRPTRELTDIANEMIATRMEAVNGVGGVNVVGGAAREIRVELDPNELRAYGVSPQQVTQALQRENQEVPAGRIEHDISERLVRVTGRITDPSAFADVVVGVRRGTPVRVRDVGKVVDGTAERSSSARLNGNAAVSFDVLKVSGSNTVEVADRVRAAIAEIDETLPDDITLTVIRDDSKAIRASLSDVQKTILFGAILTIAVIYLFLNSWRSTVITGLTLPVSIISAFFIMWVFSFTVNTMTLLALSLAIGLLIDDAIVVRENIVRHASQGKDHVQAARDGTSEIGLAVVSTSLAVVAVFIPVGFMGGQIGRIFFQFGVTVAFAVLVSLFVSFTLDPMLSAVWADPDIEHHGETGAPHGGPIRRVALAFNRLFERIAGHYPGGLEWALRHRFLVLAGAGSTVVASFILLPILGFQWLPVTDSGEINVSFRAPPGASLDYTVDKGQEVSQFLQGLPEVLYTYTTIGGGFGAGANGGTILVELKPRAQRKRTQQDIETALRGQLRQIPGVRASITPARSIFGGAGQPLSILVQGPEMSRLKIAAADVLSAMQRVQGVADPTSSDDGEIPQLNVNVDRQQAWNAGVGVSNIAQTLQPLFAGQRATEWEDAQGYTHDVIVEYPDSLRTSAADVANIPIPSSTTDPRSGQPVMIPLAQVADIQSGVGPQQIQRQSMERQVTVSAGILPGYVTGKVADDVERELSTVSLPAGYHTVFSGEVQNLQETKGYVLEAIILAVIFIYLILASLFGSFLQPLAIMLALPLSLIGVALALWVTNGTLNVMSMIGIIMLMGLVTKNGILLVDFTNQQREAGSDRKDALLTAGRVRIRPIIMTTASMIFGMLPLALALGEGAEERAPMARAVIGGLLTSTLLTLFVVPVMYTLLDDLARFALKKPSAVPVDVPVPQGIRD